MPTIREYLALRERLQAVEDGLVAEGKRHVTIQGLSGVFDWRLPHAVTEPAEEVVRADDIQNLEGMIISQRRHDMLIATRKGTFSWKPRSVA